MKVPKKSKYQTHEKPKRRNWRARGPLVGPWRAKGGILLYFLTSIVAKHQKIEGWKKFDEKKIPEKKFHYAEKTERGTL